MTSEHKAPSQRATNIASTATRAVIRNILIQQALEEKARQRGEKTLIAPTELQKAMNLWLFQNPENPEDKTPLDIKILTTDQIELRVRQTIETVYSYFEKNGLKPELLDKLSIGKEFARHLLVRMRDPLDHLPLFNEAMKYFCEYVAIAANKGPIAFEYSFENFPPANNECIDGTAGALYRMLVQLRSPESEVPIISAHSRIAMQFAAETKIGMHPGQEIHVPLYMAYALAIDTAENIKQKDSHILNTKWYIQAGTMWNILRNYPRRFMERVEAEVSDQLNAKKTTMMATTLENISKLSALEIVQANPLLITKPKSEDEAIAWVINTSAIITSQRDTDQLKAEVEFAKLVERGLKEKISPIDIGHIVKFDDDDITKCIGWDREQSTLYARIESGLDSALRENPHPAMALLQNAHTAVTPLTQGEEEHIRAIASYGDLFKDNAVQHLIYLLGSKNPEAKLVAVEALWVLGEDFKGNSSIYFLNLLDKIQNALQPKEREQKSSDIDMPFSDAFWGMLKADLPEEQQFNIERIKERVGILRTDEVVSPQVLPYLSDRSNTPLDILISLTLPASEIIARIDSNSEEFAQISHMHYAHRLILHPQRMEILKHIKSKNLGFNSDLLGECITDAAFYNDTECCKYLLGNFNTTDEKVLAASETNKYTPLYPEGVEEVTALINAARNGNLEIVKLLRDAGAPVNDIAQGVTAFGVAVANEKWEVVAELVKETDIAIVTIAFSALAKNGNFTGIRTILDNRDLPKEEIEYALLMAVSIGSPSIVNYLLDKPNLATDIICVDYPEKSPLMLAVTYGNEEIVDTLLARLAGQNLPDNLVYGCLNIAIAAKNDQIFGKLLKHADLEKQIYAGLLHMATDKECPEIIKMLIEAKADVNQVYQDGISVLMRAVLKGNTEMVEILLEAGADAKKVTEEGKSILIYARNTTLADMLLRSGAPVDVADMIAQVTPLMCAIQNDNTEVARMLVEAGADVNKEDSGGKTSLMCAAHKGNTEVAKMLVEAGADVNKEDSGGKTSLMCAAHKGNTEVAKMLVEAGADINKEDSDGITALLFAASQDHTAIVNMLFEIPGLDSTLLKDPEFATQPTQTYALIQTNIKFIEQLHTKLEAGLPGRYRGVIAVGIKYITEDNQTEAYPVIGPAKGQEELFNQLIREPADNQVIKLLRDSLPTPEATAGQQGAENKAKEEKHREGEDPQRQSKKVKESEYITLSESFSNILKMDLPRPWVERTSVEGPKTGRSHV